MSLDELFPLNRFSPRLQVAICSEFAGRCPSRHEVAAIPDARWLATPAIGPAILRKIRAVEACDEPLAEPVVRPMSDAELLARLAALQAELHLLQRAVRMTLPPGAREGRPRRLRPRAAAGHGPQEHRPRGRSAADHGWSTTP